MFMYERSTFCLCLDFDSFKGFIEKLFSAEEENFSDTVSNSNNQLVNTCLKFLAKILAPDLLR